MLILQLILAYLLICLMTLGTGILLNSFSCLIAILPYGKFIYGKYLSFSAIIHELCHLTIGKIFGFYPLAIHLVPTNGTAYVILNDNYHFGYTGWLKRLELIRVKIGVVAISLAPALIMPILALPVLSTALDTNNQIIKLIGYLFWASLVIECRPSKQDWQNAGIEL